MRRVKLDKLLAEKEKLEKKLAEEKHKLKVLKQKFREEYRKREASFLIAVGRTVLKYGEVLEIEGEKMLVLPLNNEALTETFAKHKDFIAISDFKEWLDKVEITGRGEEKKRGERKEKKGGEK